MNTPRTTITEDRRMYFTTSDIEAIQSLLVGLFIMLLIVIASAIFIVALPSENATEPEVYGQYGQFETIHGPH